MPILLSKIPFPLPKFSVKKTQSLIVRGSKFSEGVVSFSEAALPMANVSFKFTLVFI
jgi:hypothetical protein